ncbi:Zinc finger C2H2-type,Zinc finger, AD-type,Zinc finger, RING/FYVE/PHD-type [Cinara cedri]|uniref:Zinc finger C2H2-type,Zinc finger, AD-type,Zinc finger, RING/FYVE/PHD-type n=1 Tax=Cinara cedri TaxID=506608 RepID=A0A5E4MJ24_9HEMI|nr:Zinc finger C2H2-type,Zinc finger, AD-type,Zinc finger, RING/FYVE/PHD-type [Cinara cedri]
MELTNKMCRLCLAVTEWPISVFDELSGKIAQCLQIRISRTDHLPKHVCVKCKDTVNEFHAYYSNTLVCQKQLDQLLMPMVDVQQNNMASTSFEPVVTINYDQNTEYKSEYHEPESWSESNQSEVDTKDTVKMHKHKTNEIDDQNTERNKTPRKIKIKLFKCTKCEESFNTKHALKEHKNDVHPHTTYKCNCCDKTFDTMCARQKHKKEEHPSITYSCDTCDYRTPYKSRMQYHENRHKKVYSVFCDTCQAGFFNKDELATHEIKNHGAEPYQCDRCSKLCTSKTNLYSHMKVHTTSTESVSYQCETCGKAFRRIGSYRRHIQSHLGLKYECSYCNKLLSSAHHLKLHVRIHTGEKNHVCEMCGKAFTVSKYLVEHKRIHTGERPFKCDLCSKGFTQKTSLRIHTRWHTGDRPYKCDVCDDRFVINTFLQRHIKKHHPPLSNLVEPVQNPNSLQTL